MEPETPAVEGWSLNHETAGETPRLNFWVCIFMSLDKPLQLCNRQLRYRTFSSPIPLVPSSLMVICNQLLPDPSPWPLLMCFLSLRIWLFFRIQCDFSLVIRHSVLGISYSSKHRPCPMAWFRQFWREVWKLLLRISLQLPNSLFSSPEWWVEFLAYSNPPKVWIINKLFII